MAASLTPAQAEVASADANMRRWVAIRANAEALFERLNDEGVAASMLAEVGDIIANAERECSEGMRRLRAAILAEVAA